jgi:uncharacterized protein involved in exopolysaccharide biosynthesis
MAKFPARTMIQDLQFVMPDYLAIFRQRFKVILRAAVLGPLVGLLVSHAFTEKYRSQSLIAVERETVAEGYKQPVMVDDVGERIARLQLALSQNQLEPIVKQMGLATDAETLKQEVDAIRQNTRIETVLTDLGRYQAGDRKNPGQSSDIAGFYVEYTGSTPEEAQQVCSELTSLLLQENLNLPQQVRQTSTEFESQLDDAKRKLDDQENKLLSFKKQHAGVLAGDWGNDMRIMIDLNAQLNAVSQRLSLAQQNKSHAESLLAQQTANRGSAQIAAQNPATRAMLENQLSDLQSQLLQLQAQYAEDHPDVVKTKAEIAEIDKKLTQVNAAEERGGDPNANSNGREAPEVRRLRSEVGHYDDVIAQTTRERQHIEEQIRRHQQRSTQSPSVEKEYQQLMRDYEIAQTTYADLLAKKAAVENGTEMETLQLSERMRLLTAANLPRTPSFPNRRLFAAGGLGSGVVVGFGIALWLDLRQRPPRMQQYW